MSRCPNTADLEKLPHRFKVMFALFCARQIEEYCKHIPEAVKAIEVTERWLDGKASEEECKKAAYTTYATYAAYAAAYVVAATHVDIAAAYTASAAAYVVARVSKNREEAIKAQWEYYYELLHFDENVEKILLGGE